MRPGFRQAMTWLHNWAGLVFGWLLLAICVGGTLSVFRPEIDAWCHPELARGPVDQVAAGAAAVRWLGGHAAGAPGWFLDLAGPRASGTTAYWSDAGGYAVRTLSPVTGSPDGIRDSRGGETFFRFHFELQLPYPWGRLLACVAAEVLLTVLATGIVAHRRIFKDFFTLRTGKARRSWLDGHVVLGVLPLPFHLLIAFTGLMTLAPLFLPWGGQAAYRGDDAAQARDLYPAITRAAAGRPAPLAPVAPMLRIAAARFGAAGIGTVSIVAPGDAAQTVTVSAGTGRAIALPKHALTFDGTTGRLLGEVRERRAAMRAFDTLYGLHVARFAPLQTRWLYFLSGLMLTGTVATGTILWTAKARRTRDFGFGLVARLHPGFVVGLPAACALMLLANRVLPLDWPGRAALETRWMFGGWAAALGYAALRPPEQGWPALLGAAAAICVATVLADIATTGHLAGGIAARDGVALGIDGALLVAAAAAALAAVAVRQRSTMAGRSHGEVLA